MRSNGLRLAALLASACMLSACVTVTPEHVPLDPGARSALSSVDVVAPIAQSEIYIDVPASNISAAAGGGLLAALVDAGVDSARASHAAKAVAPLRDAASDVNFDAQLKDQLIQAAAAQPGLHIASTRVIKDASDTNLDQIVANTKSGDVLIITTNYHLSNDGGSLWIEAHANLYAPGLPLPKDGTADHKSAVANAAYRNAFFYTSKVPNPSKDRDVNIAAWSNNHAELLRTHLKRGGAKIADLVMSDVLATNVTPGTTSASDGSLTRFPIGTEQFTAN